MKQLMKHFRSAIVAILGIASFFLMVSEPSEDYSNWTQAVIISKSIAFVLAIASCKLFDYWDGKGLLSDERVYDDIKTNDNN